MSIGDVPARQLGEIGARRGDAIARAFPDLSIAFDRALENQSFSELALLVKTACATDHELEEPARRARCGAATLLLSVLAERWG